jgi:glutamate--cysteine ligase
MLASTVPHLTTALTGPLLELESHLLAKQSEIEHWLRSEWRKSPAPFYSSVDLRNAGFKLAPVDTNLFSAGFNNLNPAFFPLAVQAVQTAIERLCPSACNVLLIPENHTRNTFYLESLATLREIIHLAGFDVRIGSLLPDLTEPETIELPLGRNVRLEPLRRNGNRVGVDEFTPCVVLMNNDLSEGVPEILQGLDQAITPPLELGWSKRLKSGHFRHYREVAASFAERIGIDPWLIDPLFEKCGEIDFLAREGEECLAEHVDHLLANIRRKYTEYKVDRPAFVLVKADAGTYGMGVMTVHDANELKDLNRKQRTRMAKSKGGREISQVILQEGVYTFETLGQAVAEPVVYLIDHFVVGGFYRVHTARGVNENLNAPGMHFEPLSFVQPLNVPDPTQAPDAQPNRFYAYGVIARLATLAAAREVRATLQPDAPKPETSA